MKTVEKHTMPARWARALINCDMSGLPELDRMEYFSYFESNPQFANPVSCSEEATLEHFIFRTGNMRLTDCLIYSFLRD